MCEHSIISTFHFIYAGRPNKMFAVLIFAIVLCSCDASRILFGAPVPSHSHQIVFQPIWKELSLRGHQVTVITPSPLKDPALTNLTEISVEFMYSLIEQKYKFSETLVDLKDEPLKFAKFFLHTLSIANEDELADLRVQRLINDPDAKFDLVIVEFLLPTMLAFGHRFNCPVIAITSLDGTLMGQDAIGNPSHPVLNPDSPLKFNVPLNFGQRIFSVVYSILRRISFIFIRATEDKVIEKYFGPGYPPLDEMVTNVDMFFMNVNPAFHNIRPTVPAVINIGGTMTIRPPKPLPKELQTFLDSAEHGVIYLSMGTNIRTKQLPERFFSEMIKAFSILPYKVVWKIDEPNLPEKTDNILVVNWVSQQDVLRHPNVKAFITQGGLQSLEDAINTKTPVACIPYFGDQFSNCIQAMNKGMGLILDHKTLNIEIIGLVVSEVAENQKYLNTVTKLSEIISDQPMTGLEKAVWWTEYVLRHNGAKHLKSPAVDMPLYQYFLIDVLAVVFAVLLVTGYISVLSIRFMVRNILKCFRPKKQESSKKKIKKS